MRQYGTIWSDGAMWSDMGYSSGTFNRDSIFLISEPAGSDFYFFTFLVFYFVNFLDFFILF